MLIRKYMHVPEPGIIRYDAGDSGVSTRWNCAVAKGENGAPRYVRVGEGGVIVTSETGASGSWTVRTSGTPNNLNFVGYLARLSVYVAVGQSNTILTSVDGVDWVAKTSPTAATWGAWADNGTHTVIVGTSGSTLRTSDFESYTTGSFFGTTGQGSSVVWTGTAFIATARTFNPVTAVVQTSTDGITWANRTINHGTGSNTPLEMVIWVGGTAIVSGTNGVVATSDSTGAVWTVRTTGVAQDLRLMAANGRVYAFGKNGVSLESSDNGATWHAGPPVGVTSFLRFGVADPSDPTRALIVGDSGVTLFGQYGFRVKGYASETDRVNNTPNAQSRKVTYAEQASSYVTVPVDLI